MGKRKEFRRMAPQKSSAKATKFASGFHSKRPDLLAIEALLEEEMELAFWRKKLDKFSRKELERYPPLARAVFLGCERAVDDLLEAGEDVNARIPKDGSTPLMIAVDKGQMAILKKLLKKGADLRTTRNNGMSALMVAVSKCDRKAFALLWDHFDKTDKGHLNQADSEGQTMLMIAVEGGHVDLARFLVTVDGVDADRQTQEGRTALMLAAARAQHDIVRCLVHARANILIEDKAGTTALCIAFAQEKSEVAGVLVEALNCKDRELYVKKRVELLSRPRLSARMEILHFYKTILFRVLREIKRTLEDGMDLLLKHKVFFALVRCAESYQCDTELLKTAFHLSACLMYSEGAAGRVMQAAAHQYVDANGPLFCLKTMSYYHTEDTVDLRSSAFLPVHACADCPSGRAWLLENHALVLGHMARFDMASLTAMGEGEGRKAVAMFESFRKMMLEIARDAGVLSDGVRGNGASCCDGKGEESSATRQSLTENETDGESTVAQRKTGNVDLTGNEVHTRKGQGASGCDPSAVSVKKKSDTPRKVKNITFHARFDQRNGEARTAKGNPVKMQFVPDVPRDVKGGAKSRQTGYADALKRNLNPNSEAEPSDFNAAMDNFSPSLQIEYDKPAPQQSNRQDSRRQSVSKSSGVSQGKETSPDSSSLPRPAPSATNTDDCKSESSSKKRSIASKFLSLLSNLYPSNGSISESTSEPDSKEEISGSGTPDDSNINALDGESGSSNVCAEEPFGGCKNSGVPSASDERSGTNGSTVVEDDGVVCKDPSALEEKTPIKAHVKLMKDSSSSKRSVRGKTHRMMIVSKILNQTQGIPTAASLDAEGAEKRGNNDSSLRVEHRTYCDVARTSIEQVHDDENTDHTTCNDSSFEQDCFRNFPELAKPETHKPHGDPVGKNDGEASKSKDERDVPGGDKVPEPALRSTDVRQLEIRQIEESYRLEAGDAHHHRLKAGSGDQLEGDVTPERSEEASALNSSPKFCSIDSIKQRLVLLEKLNPPTVSYDPKTTKLRKYVAFYRRLTSHHLYSKRLISTPKRTDCEDAKAPNRSIKKKSVLTANWISEDRIKDKAASQTLFSQSDDQKSPVVADDLRTAPTPTRQRTPKLSSRRDTESRRRIAREEGLKKRRILFDDPVGHPHAVTYLDAGFVSTFIHCEAGSRWFPVLKGIQYCMPLAKHVLDLHCIETNGSRIRCIESSAGKVVFGAKLGKFWSEGERGSFVGLLQKGGVPVVVRMTPAPIFAEEEVSRKRNLSHKNLAKFVDGVVELDRLHLVSEHCEFSLPEFLRESQNCRFSVGVPASFYKRLLIHELLEGVRHLHDRRIVHGFLKPTNVLVTSDYRLKLTDYFLLGVVPPLWGIRLSDPQNRPVGAAISSFVWRPTELIGAQTESDARESITAASDIQMTGMVMYFIMSGGRHPFGASELECQENVKQGAPLLGTHPTDVEGRDLIQETLHADAPSRPTIWGVNRHPFFWDMEKRFQFLLCVGRKIEFYTSKCTRTADEFRKSCIEARDWTFYIQENLMQYISECTKKTYSDDFPDLLHFAITLHENFPYMPQHLQSFVHQPSRYILITFPTLLMSTFHVIRRNFRLQQQMALKSFF